MATRFTDDLITNTSGSDFIVRRRIPLSVQILLIFLFVFVLNALAGALINTQNGKAIFYITLAVSLGALAWFTIFFSSRQRDLVLATEFQNAILSSATQLSTRFCLITKRDGAIVYYDPGFQKVFATYMQGGSRAIDMLLDAAGVSPDITGKIITQLEQNQNDRIVLQLRDADQQPMPIMLSIESLPRPRGYFLMRGRDYVEKRIAEVNGDTPRTEIPLQALSALPDGILIADGNGIITFVNPVLEQWLGYATGEIVSLALNKNQIFYQYGSQAAGTVVNGNFEGDVVLQAKNKALLALQIRQAALPQGGISAIITLPDRLKKK